MGLFNWPWAGRRRGSNPPAPSSKPEPPAGPPMQPPGRRELQWEAAIDGLRDVLTDQTKSAVQPAWQRSRILTAMHLMAANPPSPPPPRNWIDPAKEKRSAELEERLSPWPRDRVKPQPPGGRLFVNGIEQPRPARRKQGLDVERLADRLDELANFVTQGPEAAERYHDADRVMSAAASLLRNRPAANHRSLLDLEADFRAWYKNEYGEPYFGAIPITVAIEWGQHLLQQHAPPGEKPEFPPPRKIREDFLP